VIVGDIIVYLSSKNVGGTLFDAYEEEPGVISGIRSTVTPYGGTNPLLSHSSADDRIDVARFQVLTQGFDKLLVEQEANRVQRELLRVRNQTINGIFYRTIVATQGPPSFHRWSEPVNGKREVSYVASYEAMKDPYLA
jgi:hypothetical protein